ncbi:MAG TPA: SCO family protein [Gemmatimonadales bacterium]|jgi:protein SCO1/2|nr:SCO family protein [Gemmatimonadales bacterium]
MTAHRALCGLATATAATLAVGCGRHVAPKDADRFHQAGIVVSGVIAAEPVATASPADATMGVYLTITNTRDVDDTLDGAESPVAAKTQIHGTMSQGGMSMMTPLAALPVPRHTDVRLRPGRMHVMLEGLRQSVSAGDTVPLTLILRRAGRLLVRARVVKYDRLEQSLGAADGAGSAGPALRLRESNGRIFDLSQERGNVVVILFGYTHCPDICPLTLANFVSVRRRLGPRAEHVRFVFVTVDPGRDSPDGTMRYARQFDSTFVGLSGDSATLAAVQRSFHVASWVSRDSSGNVLVAHSASVFVVGPDGGLARVVPHDEADVERISAAVEEALGT